MSFKPQNVLAWSEIPVTDLDTSADFYRTVFNWEITVSSDMGPNPTGMISTAGPDGVAGHLYPGKPAQDGEGPTLHFLVPDTIEDSMARLVKAGGKEISPPIPFPGGRFAYATDLDGNSLGLYQPPSST